MEPPSHLPETNRKVAELLFAIEVGLRELIIETLSSIDGERWHKQLLPADVYQKYLNGRRAERAAKWTNHVAHHPLYYVDFPDLAKVLNTNWKDVFQQLFGNRDVFLANLKSLEPIRNSFAHSRKISEEDERVVSGVFATFESAIGKNRLKDLIQHCTVAPSICETMRQMKNELEMAFGEIESLATPTCLRVWPMVEDSWWFDENFLTANNHKSRLEIAKAKLDELRKAVASTEREIEQIGQQKDVCDVTPTEELLAPVYSFFQLHFEYAALPRVRGSGHRLEAWLESKDLESIARVAKQSINSISETVNE